MNKILFITQDAERTGAPIVLLALLKSLKSDYAFSFDIIFLRTGGIIEEFRSLADNVIILKSKEEYNIFKRFFITYNKKWDKINRYIPFLKRQKYSLIYANTVVSAGYGVQLKNILSIPAILHVHELDHMIDIAIGHDSFSRLANRFDHIITVSNATKDELIANYNIPEKDISIVYGFSCNDAVINKTKSEIFNELGISNNTFIVGASGSAHWRKGVDIFIGLARRIILKHPFFKCIFIWVGNADEETGKQIKYDLEKLNLADRVLFIGEKHNPLDYFNIFDVFTLVSRVDPFPLVCLENAMLAKPVLCFQNAGGAVELVEDDAGFIIPYGDIEKMSEKVVFLYQNPGIKNELGLNAKSKVISKYLKKKSIDAITCIIKSYNASS
jgi:glycosyltransferase involved in cell wall biosynthesis